MYISYAKTQDQPDREVQMGDTATVWEDGDERFVTVMEIYSNPVEIRTQTMTGNYYIYISKRDFFDAIGAV